jgi:uncharacterized protein YggE
MTITLRGRTAALLASGVVGVVLAYLVGSAHAGGSSAAAATSRDDVPTTLTSALTSSGTAISGSANGVTVSGTGTASGTPDTLDLELSVDAQGGDVSSALGAANRAAAAVQHSLRDHGVASRDMQTSGLQLQPSYTSSGRVDGYTADESLTVTLRDVGRAGSAISAAVAAGGDAVRVDGVSLDLADSSSLLAAARDKAFADARAKAEQYAKDAGRALGQVLAVDDTVVSQPPVPYAAGGFAAEKAGPVPVQAGTQQVDVQVTVVFGWA